MQEIIKNPGIAFDTLE
jgi:hypothetical protein